MGGGGSTMYAQRHPELFSSCYAMRAWLSFDGKNDYPKDSRPYVLQEAVRTHSALRFLENADPSTSSGQALFEALRTLRWEIAKEESRAPYLIMGDKTLHELATTKPTDLLAFGNTFGIGQHKCETYGERFLAVIKDYPITAVNHAKSTH